MEFFVKFLLKDIEVRLKLLDEEFLHIESVINFFSLGGSPDISSDTSLRKVMYRLCKPVETYKRKHR